MEHQELTELVDKIGNHILYHSPKILAGVIVLLIGWFIARMIRQAFEKTIQRFQKVDKTISSFLANVIYILLLTLIVVMAMSTAGIPTTPLIGAMTAILFGVALSMRNTYNIVASGVIIAFSRPFKIGDFVDVGGSTGTVERIGFLFTDLRMTDGRLNEIPNSLILTRTITNFNASDQRRNDLSLLLYHDANIENVKATILEMLNENELVIKASQDEKKAPIIEISAIDTNGITLLIRYWSMRVDFFKALWKLNADLKSAIDNGVIRVAKPQRFVIQDSESPSA